MKLYKSLVVIFALTFSFSQSAFALIVEGTFSGTTGQFFGENMNLSPDAAFFRGQEGEQEFDFDFENSFQPFTGNFWYDTDIVGPGISPWSPTVTMYISDADWLHVNVVGANGASIAITSRGNAPTFSEKPNHSIYIVKEGEGSRYQESMSMFYGDYGPWPYRETGPNRDGALVISSTIPFLNGISLIQDIEFSPEENPNNVRGGVRLSTKGVVDGVIYEGEFSGSVNKFEMHIRDSVAVPEPSSLILLLLPLAFLTLRARLLSSTRRT
jgi:hypothetical protein